METDLINDIKKECELAYKTKKLPKIDPELKHLYIRIFNDMASANKFIIDVWPIFELLEQLGEVEIIRRKAGSWRFKDGLNGQF